MKKLSLFASVAAATLAIASIFPVANTWANTAEYTGPSTITLSHEVSNVTNAVTNDFTYTITNTVKPDGATVSGAPTTATVSFNNVTPVDNKAKASTSINFANADFSKVGDYTFTITESTSTDATNYPIDASKNDYSAIVQVRYYTDPTTNVADTSRYVAYIALENKDGDKIGSHTDSTLDATWGSAAARTYFQIGTTTTGNLSDPSTCFAYEISIPAGNGVTAGDEFAINSSTSCTGGATSVTAGTPATIYLKHGDSATVGQNGTTNQLPVGASYTITKTDTTDEYKTYIDGSTTESRTITKTTVPITDTNFASTSLTEIENNKNTDPMTGIVTNVWTYIILMIVGFFGFILLARRKKDDEEQQQ